MLAKDITIHSSAIINPTAVIESNVQIGPFCIVGPNVRLGQGTILHSHAVVTASTVIGAKCIIHPNAVIGGGAQVLGHNPSDVEKGTLTIGDRCVFRENVTVHRSVPDKHGNNRPTRIGNDCLLMAGVHIAHDCEIGNGVILVQGVGLAGHVVVEDGAVISGLAGVHQYCRIGKYSMVAAGSLVTNDVLPFTLVKGDRARTVGLNDVGLRRRQWSESRITKARLAIAGLLGRPDAAGEVRGIIEDLSADEDARTLTTFAKASERGFCSAAGQMHQFIARQTEVDSKF